MSRGRDNKAGRAAPRKPTEPDSTVLPIPDGEVAEEVDAALDGDGPAEAIPRADGGYHERPHESLHQR